MLSVSHITVLGDEMQKRGERCLLQIAKVLFWLSVIVLVVVLGAWYFFEQDAEPWQAEQSIWKEAGIDQDQAMYLVRHYAQMSIAVCGFLITSCGIIFYRYIKIVSR